MLEKWNAGKQGDSGVRENETSLSYRVHYENYSYENYKKYNELCQQQVPVPTEIILVIVKDKALWLQTTYSLHKGMEFWGGSLLGLETPTVSFWFSFRICNNPGASQTPNTWAQQWVCAIIDRNQDLFSFATF